MRNKTPAILLVANWVSDIGFAWWLMESYWVTLASHFEGRYRSILAYPKITKIPDSIASTEIEAIQESFSAESGGTLFGDLRVIRDKNVRIIYLTDRPAVSLRYIVYRLAGVERIFTHDHTPGLRTKPSRVKFLLKWIISRVPLITADAVIGATDFVRQRNIETRCFPANRCFVAPNGLPAEVTVKRENPRQSYDISEDSVIMVMTARANSFKRIDFAIRCLARYQKESDSTAVHFLLLGDGPALASLKQLAADEGVAGSCSFPGYVESVSALLPFCDFAVHPSAGEVGYSLAILEYMRAGLPVLVPNNASVCGATSDGVTGFIFSENNEAECTQLMARLAEDCELRTKMGHAAQMEEKNYSLTIAQKALVEVFEELI